MARDKKKSKPKPGSKKQAPEQSGVAGEAARYRNVLEFITPEFVEEGARRIRHEDVRAVVLQAAKLRKKFRAGEVLDRFRAEAFALLDMLREFERGRYPEAPLWAVAVGTFSLQYVLKPVDIIPDSLPVVGQLDDALVVSQGLALVRRELHGFKVWKLASAALDD